jgi:hypothetical protein
VRERESERERERERKIGREGGNVAQTAWLRRQLK